MHVIKKVVSLTLQIYVKIPLTKNEFKPTEEKVENVETILKIESERKSHISKQRVVTPAT